MWLFDWESLLTGSKSTNQWYNFDIVKVFKIVHIFWSSTGIVLHKIIKEINLSLMIV